MKDKTILLEQIIGKTITDIRCKYGQEYGWLDTAECFIELDNKFYIEIPYGETKDILLLDPDPEAETIFTDLSDIPHYHVNKDDKSITDIREVHKKRKPNIFCRLRNILFGYDPALKDYELYKIDYTENRLKNIINRVIVDYLWQNEEHSKGFFELDNGCFISDHYMSPHGTGLSGLHYYDSFNSLKENKGDNLKRHSQIKNSSY